MRKIYLGLWAALAFALIVPPVPADASPITRTFDFTATGFGPGAPVDPVIGSVTVTFDPTVFKVTNVPVDAFSINIALTHPTGIVFDYPLITPSNDELIVYDPLTSSGIAFGTDDFSLRISNASTSTPSFHVFDYSQTGLSFFPTLTGTVTVPSSGVPEPTTLAVLGLGLAGLGFMRRRLAA